MEQPKIEAFEKKELLNEVLHSQQIFEEAIETAKFSKPSLPTEILQHIEYVQNEFKKLFSRIDEAQSDDDFNKIRERAKELENRRAYVLPVEDLLLTANTLSEEMVSWNIPKCGIDQVAEKIKKLSDPGCVEAEKREALLKIVEDYDYWGVYADWIEDKLRRAGKVFFISMLFGLLSAGYAFLIGYITVGFIAAGMCGASLSILLKLPSNPDYKESLNWEIQAGARFATGIISAVVGFGFLASGIVSISVSCCGEAATISDLILKCKPWQNSFLVTLILLALGIIFGFTERAFASFESSIIGKFTDK